MTGIVDFRTELLDETGAPITASNPLPTTGGGGGGTSQVELVDPDGNPIDGENPLSVHDEAAHQLLTRLLQYLNAPQGYDKSLQRQRGTVVVESGTVTAVTTVTTVTSLNNYDGYNARMPVLDTNRTAWAQCVRARIT